MEGEIEAFAFHFVRYPQADENVDRLEDDERSDGVINDDRSDAVALVDELLEVAVERAGGAAVLLHREHAGEESTDNAADRVDAEAVEGVVIAEHVLEAGCAPVAEDAGGDTDRHGAGGTDKARGGGDGDQASNRTRANA